MYGKSMAINKFTGCKKFNKNVKKNVCAYIYTLTQIQGQFLFREQNLYDQNI
jgi:hypothetical protein